MIDSTQVTTEKVREDKHDALDTDSTPLCSVFLNFLKNVERYADTFNDFLISADRADPDSPHAPFVREGMSDKPVSFESIPKFQDSVRLGDAFKGAILDVMLLLLFFIVLFTAAHVSFQRKEI